MGGRGLMRGLLPRTAAAPGPPTPPPPPPAAAAAVAVAKAKVLLVLLRGVPRNWSLAPAADVAVGRVLLGVRLRWAVTSSRDLQQQHGRHDQLADNM
jgi:hypothetical protein